MRKKYIGYGTAFLLAAAFTGGAAQADRACTHPEKLPKANLTGKFLGDCGNYCVNENKLRLEDFMDRLGITVASGQAEKRKFHIHQFTNACAQLCYKACPE